MATNEQRAASLKVMDAVTQLNRALEIAASEGLHVRLLASPAGRNHRYTVKTIESREMVLPGRGEVEDAV